MKFEYIHLKKCDGCDFEKQTRDIIGLDPRRQTRLNYICKKCDKSYNTIPKILEWNKKHLPETHSIFGFPLDQAKNITSIKINFLDRAKTDG